jgi:hypothetical protein
MKKFYLIVLLLSILIVSTVAVGLTVYGYKSDKDSVDTGDSENNIVGGYSADRALTKEDLEVFNKAMNGLVGVVYEPTLVSTQVVAGMNYRFTTTATIVYPNAEPYTAYVYVFKSLEGSVELIEIIKVDN